MASGTNRRRRSMSTTSKQYPRTARLNELGGAPTE